MRFQKLQIPAFGPFTNLDLTFQAEPLDLHVIYGANEAGKSSLLRAIRDLLFGIHGQSPDNFLHDYADLRIKGEIGNRAGGQLILQRRKGNKNTLLDATGKQLPESALVPFLGSVDLPYFSAMFGLGARELHEGAQQLLRGEGEMGAALFSASLGGTPVQMVAEVLQQDAERLFRGRAAATIRSAAANYRELIKKSREAMVNPEAWDKTAKDLASAEEEEEQRLTAISTLEAELGWLQRCEDALPTVGHLAEETQKINQLPQVPALGTDFITRAQSARRKASDAQGEVRRFQVQLGRLEAQLLECTVNPALLTHEEKIDRFHQNLGAYRARNQSLTDLRARLSGLDPVIRAGMTNLQLEGEFASLDSHRVSSAGQLAFGEAAEALQSALEQQNANAGKAETLKEHIMGEKSELNSLPVTDLGGIREALALAANATDADRTLATSEREVQRLAREMTSQHVLVTGAPGDLDATTSLPVPSLATIRRYHDEMDGLQRRIRDQQQESYEVKERTETIRGELARLQRQGELPSEESLQRARDQRNRGWELVLEDWKGGGAKEDFVPGVPLENSYPQAVAKADEIADKLRLDAEAVAQAEEKRLQITEAQRQLGDTDQNTRRLEGDLQQHQAAWLAEWSACEITPRSPAKWRSGGSSGLNFATAFKT